MASEQLQNPSDRVPSPRDTDVVPKLEGSQENPNEEPEFCAIPIHILSKAQKYFLDFVPEPGKIISITLSAEDAPTILDQSHIQSLLEPIAIPEHVLLPLQEFFIGKRSNPTGSPKYIGISFSLMDASLCDNLLSHCPPGCTHGFLVSDIGARQMEGVPCESQGEDSAEVAENESEGEHERHAASESKSAASEPQSSNDVDDVAKEDTKSSAEAIAEHGV